MPVPRVRRPLAPPDQRHVPEREPRCPLQPAEAGTLDALILAERDAALVYWSTWAPVEIRFRPGDVPRLPGHWHRFGKRGSPLTQAPRLAVNPINALLNYLYATLEAESRIACLTVGLDTTLGIVHADYAPATHSPST